LVGVVPRDNFTQKCRETGRPKQVCEAVVEGSEGKLKLQGRFPERGESKRDIVVANSTGAAVPECKNKEGTNEWCRKGWVRCLGWSNRTEKKKKSKHRGNRHAREDSGFQGGDHGEDSN